MEASERRAVLILADISGYTKFMVANQLAAVHGQQAITLLIETILREVDIPLILHAIEGDAVFLSASHPGDEEGWREVLAEVRIKLPRFFEVFLEGIVRTAEATPCKCASCQHLEELRLKIIVHSGRAVYHTIAGLPQIAGTDVILAHRLLKNSVPSNEYLLMTDAAYDDIGREMQGEFLPGEEHCEGFGAVRTWVHLMGPAREQARDALYAKSDAALAAEGRRYARWAVRSTFGALVEQWKHPAVRVPWWKQIAFTAGHLLKAPLFFAVAKREGTRNLVGRRSARQRQ
ncbi:MAG: DUF2652 domain-containing protein [Deltaproteobacteria bacterium]|nr:DUF2652 domain-containing protein [Deltaproteobacteria bacterium]